MILLLILALVWAFGSTVCWFFAACANQEIAMENRRLRSRLGSAR